MKSNLFRKILDQTTVEINVPYAETVRRLRAQEGYCYEMDHLDYNYYFSCNKKGEFTINTYQRPRTNFSRKQKREASFRSYYVLGEVLNENGKSKINIYSVYDRLNKSVLLFDILIDLMILVPLSIIVLVATDKTPWDLWATLFFIVLLLGGLFRLISDHNYKTPELETMKEIALRKIEAAKRWNE